MQPGYRLYADKGYSGRPNATLLKKYNIKSAIQRQFTQYKSFTDWAKRLNKWVANTCYKVERVWGQYEKRILQCRRSLYRYC